MSPDDAVAQREKQGGAFFRSMNAAEPAVCRVASNTTREWRQSREALLPCRPLRAFGFGSGSAVPPSSFVTRPRAEVQTLLPEPVLSGRAWFAVDWRRLQPQPNTEQRNDTDPTDGEAVPRIKDGIPRLGPLCRLYPWDRAAIRGHFS